MIYLKAYAVLFSQNRKIKLKHIDLKRRFFWPNNFFDEINIFEPEQWKWYLAEKYKMPNGRKLPSKTIDGDPIVYEVYMWGTSKMAQEYFNKKTGPGGSGGRIYLFPGYHKEGPRKSTAKYGWIRKAGNYFF